MCAACDWHFRTLSHRKGSQQAPPRLGLRAHRPLGTATGCASFVHKQGGRGADRSPHACGTSPRPPGTPHTAATSAFSKTKTGRTKQASEAAAPSTAAPPPPVRLKKGGSANQRAARLAASGPPARRTGPPACARVWGAWQGVGGETLSRLRAEWPSEPRGGEAGELSAFPVC